MRKTILSGAVLAAVLIFAACKKDDPVVTPTPTTPDGTALTSFFTTNTSNAKQTFTVNATTGGTVTGSKGTAVTILANSLTNASGGPVSGNVTVELIEIFDRASMVMMNKPTVGILPNGSHSTLISGGEYYLRIHQNGQEVSTQQGVYVSIPTSNTGGLDTQMSLFNGVVIENNFLWEEDQQNELGVDSIGTSYNILEGEWGWTNVDKFYNDPRPKTEIRAKLPAGYDNTNSEVFITYDGEPTALASLDVYNTAGGYFSEHYGLIPIGLNVHFIAVTMINGQLHYAIQATTITDGHVEQITSFTPTTQAALATLINNLP